MKVWDLFSGRNSFSLGVFLDLVKMNMAKEIHELTKTVKYD